MKTLLLSLLSIVSAAALGGALTFAILPRQAVPPAPSVAVPETRPLPLVLAEVAEVPPRNELAERIFQGYHESVTAEFLGSPGFGIGRTGPHPGFTPFLDTNFSRFDFTFIGNDPEKRKYKVEDPALQTLPLVFHISEAYERREKAREVTPLRDSGALFDKDLKPKVSLPTGADFAVLARFEAAPEKYIELHPVAGGTLGYGALRASGSCLLCHEKKVGALLGLFRYRFEHGPGGTLPDLALK